MHSVVQTAAVTTVLFWLVVHFWIPKVAYIAIEIPTNVAPVCGQPAVRLLYI